MKFLSLMTRIGLLALGFILIATVNADSVWEEPEDTMPTTSDLSEDLLYEWGLPLLVLGILMAVAMIGAAYLVRDERMENLLWEFGGEEE
jgi:NADH:ubiquinone oxidoreductase subunit 6 (subunit J)